MSVCRLHAAFSGWLGTALVVACGAVGVGLVVTGGLGVQNHGGSAFVLGGAVVGGCLLAAAHVILRLESSPSRGVRGIGAAVLVFGASLCAFYPVSWLRDPYSLPAPAALISACLFGLQLFAAWSLVAKKPVGGL